MSFSKRDVFSYHAGSLDPEQRLAMEIAAETDDTLRKWMAELAPPPSTVLEQNVRAALNDFAALPGESVLGHARPDEMNYLLAPDTLDSELSSLFSEWRPSTVVNLAADALQQHLASLGDALEVMWPRRMSIASGQSDETASTDTEANSEWVNVRPDGTFKSRCPANLLQFGFFLLYVFDVQPETPLLKLVQPVLPMPQGSDYQIELNLGEFGLAPSSSEEGARPEFRICIVAADEATSHLVSKPMHEYLMSTCADQKQYEMLKRYGELL